MATFPLRGVGFRIEVDRLVATTAPRGRTRPAVLAATTAKRAFDIVVGTLLCVLAAPLVLLFAVGVAATLRCWPFFVQQRPGWRGRSLTIIKLRTLPPSTPRYMHKHDLGLATMPLPLLCRVLRRSHLDELPQLASVVLGHMSLVGPRPALPPEVEPIRADFDALRRSVRPGCTGVWQLSVASHEALANDPRFDVFYIHNASVRLDLWLLIRTAGWALGIVKPLEIADIPRWLLGQGLLTDGAHLSASVPAAWLEPAEEVFPGPPVYAPDEHLVGVSDHVVAVPQRSPHEYDRYAPLDELVEVTD